MSLDWLPDAVRVPHGSVLHWTQKSDPKGVLHTTESSSWPSYDGWTILPHATVLPTPGKGVTVHQHIPFTQASFALRHLDSQATNTDYAFQFELIGTSAKGGPGYYWPEADDAVLLDLYEKVMEPLDSAFVIPFKAVAFKSYPASFGTSNGIRMSDNFWNTYSGWCGHEHVPQNDHGDPGLFPWARLMAIVEETMLSKSDVEAAVKEVLADPATVKALAKALFSADVINAPTTSSPSIAPDPSNPTWQMRSYLNEILTRADTIVKTLEAEGK